MHAAGQGIKSHRLWHPLPIPGIPSSELNLFSTGFMKGWRVLLAIGETVILMTPPVYPY